MVKKRKTSKKSMARKTKHKIAKQQFKADFWLMLIFFIAIGRAILLLPGATGAIIVDPSLIMHDPLDSEATILENNGMMSGLEFFYAHINKGALLERGDVLEYDVPDGFNSDRGAIEMWIKPCWDPGSDTDKHFFFSAYDREDSGNRIEFFYYPAFSAFVMKVVMGSKVYRAVHGGSVTSLNKEQWNHIAATWGPKYGVRVYINGVERGFYRTGVGSIWDDVSIDINPAKLIIGNSDDPAGVQQPVDALIDEIKLYNEEKTSFFVS